MVDTVDHIAILRDGFNDHVGLREVRPGVFKLLIPVFHEDGDMIDVFVEPQGDTVRISDEGLTLMRLSYTYDIDTANKRKIFERILSDYGLQEADGLVYTDAEPGWLCPAVLRFTQAVAKICNMRAFRREVVRSLFYEMLQEFVEDSLQDYGPVQNTHPLPYREELEVDYEFSKLIQPAYLFGVPNRDKARLATIACQGFQLQGLKFRSVAVHESFEGLPSKDRLRVTSALDKQFISLDDLRENGRSWFERNAV